MFATEEAGGLAALAERVRPIAASRTRLLAVPPPVAPLLPDGGLRRGTAVRCCGDAASSLAMALAAAASAAGSWCALVGTGDPGVLAAAGYGMDVDRLAVVAAPSDRWAPAVATLLGGVDVVVVEPPPHLRPAAVRTLCARARDRGAVLVVVGVWPGPAEVELAVTDVHWHGLGQGAGRLQARRVTVVARGRGSAAQPVHRELWLPTAAGGVAGA